MRGVGELVWVAMIIVWCAIAQQQPKVDVSICQTLDCEPSTCANVSVAADHCDWLPMYEEAQYFGCNNVTVDTCIEYRYHSLNFSQCNASSKQGGAEKNIQMSKYYTCGECKTGHRHDCDFDNETGQVLSVTEYNCSAQDCSFGCTVMNRLKVGECIEGMTLENVFPCRTMWHHWYDDPTCNDSSPYPYSGSDRIVLDRCIWAVSHAYIWHCP